MKDGQPSNAASTSEHAALIVARLLVYGFVLVGTLYPVLAPFGWWPL